MKKRRSRIPWSPPRCIGHLPCLTTTKIIPPRKQFYGSNINCRRHIGSIHWHGYDDNNNKLRPRRHYHYFIYVVVVVILLIHHPYRRRRYHHHPHRHQRWRKPPKWRPWVLYGSCTILTNCYNDIIIIIIVVTVTPIPYTYRPIVNGTVEHVLIPLGTIRPVRRR